ncbi:hypothetical protein lbkm_0838 [Lachnospiraceae bacterium KM106-2]|nr:hypothetical protein lbkm_0838 [Lachnospiraceae bacterium KM106-2]
MFGHTTANATSTSSSTQQQATFDKKTVTAYTEQMFTQWSAIDYSFLDNKDEAAIYKDNLGEEAFARYQDWYSVTKEAGKFEKKISTKVVMKKNTAVATIRAKYSKKNVSFVMKFNKSMKYSMPAVTIDNNGNKNKASVVKALLNTLMGMGTVFIVLIFISFLISLFKYIPSLFDKSAKKNDAVETKSVASAPVVEEEEELADDGELVAVITAAIMASMGDEAPADGLVVRSIRKVNKSKWKNA